MGRGGIGKALPIIITRETKTVKRLICDEIDVL